MSRCQVKLMKKNEYQVVEVHGYIDENFSSVTKDIPASDFYLFNFKNLLSINSSGIREWIKYITQYPKAKFILAECPKVFIDQVNMVEGFINKNCQIISFYVPYFSEDNDSEKLLLAQFGKHYTETSNDIASTIKDDAGVEYEIDVIPTKYFKFLAKK